MVSRKKVQSEIKKAFRLPSNAAVMTMMAVILVCAAPALVSVIDDSAQSDITYEKDIQVIPEGITAKLFWSDDTPESTDKTFATLVEDNIITVVLTTPASSAYLTAIKIYGFDSAIIDGLVKLSLISDIETKPFISTSVGDVYKQIHGFQAIDGGYSYTPSSYDRALIGNGNSESLVFNYMVSDESSIYTVSVFAEYGTTIPYGEIIIGATGALLIICAILATPWVSTSGLTVKRRR